MRWLAVALATLAAGCGGDDGDGSDAPAGSDASSDAVTDAATSSDVQGGACGAVGAGSVNGTVMGVAISPVMGAFEDVFGQGTVIILEEDAGMVCNPFAEGEHLSLAFLAHPGWVHRRSSPGARSPVREATPPSRASSATSRTWRGRAAGAA